MSPRTYNRARPAASGFSHILCRSGAALSSRPCRVGSDPWRSSSPSSSRPGARGGDETAGTTTGAGTETGTAAAPSSSKITLRAGSTNAGPWVQSLSLEHGPDGEPTDFFVCAAWDEARPREGCDAAPGAGTASRNDPAPRAAPVGAAVESPDSPGWATVGTAETAELEIPLSDFVAGLDVEKATYRVTLRPRTGGSALATSNPITVAWSE